jgi:hypothetical protein
MMPRRPLLKSILGAAGLALLLILVGTTPSAETPGRKGRQYVVLIGMDKYRSPDIAPLPCTVTDVRELAGTFRKRNADQEPPQIKELMDETCKGLMEKLPHCLARAKPEDRVLVYFTGHGFRDADNKRLYLAPVDFDKDRPAQTGVAVTWLRDQIANCRAGTKLLILDACHAGSDKGVAKGEVTAEELARPMEDLAGVVTLASSKANEKSLPWDAFNQSLFTYWLIQGLNGHADRDGDGVIDVDELYKYVHANVTRTAPLVAWSRKQTPVYIRRGDVEGVPVVFRPRPQLLKELLCDMAAQLALCLGQSRVERVGVLEFLGDSGLGDYGILGRRCAQGIEDFLASLKLPGTNKVRVAAHRELQKVLAAQKFSVGDLSSAEALQKLSRGAGGALALVEGEIRSREGRFLDIRCKLLNAETREELGRAAGRAEMTENDWAMLGRSGLGPSEELAEPPDEAKKDPAPPESKKNPPAGQAKKNLPPEDTKKTEPPQEAPKKTEPPKRPPEGPAGGEGTVVEKLEENAKKPHPFANPGFPFRVRIAVVDPTTGKAKERLGVLKGNDWVVQLNEGEEYEIQIDHPIKEPVVMRLLVDGLNTLPEPSPEKGIETKLWGKPVNLDEATYWVLDPNNELKRSRVAGFYDRTGADAHYYRFTVARAEEALAVRQQFTERIGLITAAFYYAEPATGARGVVGTRAGRDGRSTTRTLAVRPADLIAVAHIRYVSKE